jgi:hypothetical protein
METKLPKIFKPYSSTEKAELETLYSPNKGSPKVIKSHEDNENSNNKTEKLFNAMNLCDDSKSLIISINLFNIKNMINLSNWNKMGFEDYFHIKTYGIKVSKTQSSKPHS